MLKYILLLSVLIIFLIGYSITKIKSCNTLKEKLVLFSFPFFYKTKRWFEQYPALTSIKPLNLPIKTYINIDILPKFLLYKRSKLSPIRRQGSCGSCWAFAITSTISDRTMIRTGGIFNKPLSVQSLLSCIDWPHGCEGGVLDDTCNWLEQNRYPLILEKSMPYKMYNSGYVTTKCIDKKDIINGIYIKPGSVRKLTEFIPEGNFYDKAPSNPSEQEYINICRQNVLNMKKELFLHGPFFCAMTVYKELYNYIGSKIYKYQGSEFVGGHAIEIVGYCDEGMDERPGFNDSGYWICRNSWGLDWPRYHYYGEGYFVIKMGTNECGIESRCGVADPDLPDLPQNTDLSSLRYELY